jgi:hypothetical protein
VIINVAIGIGFVAGARGRKPMPQNIAERRSGPFSDRADIRYLFRLLTLLWAGYFFESNLQVMRRRNVHHV